tara:strand:- start:55 stop:738 length:684 start_codon:yes stop_codon:yes gene_type:complete
MDNILYAKLPIVFENYKQSLDHYKKINDDTWFWDTYREVRMLPLYTPGGATTKSGSQNNRKADLDWTEYADKDTMDFFEQKVFPWLDKKGRIILLKTPPNDSLAVHIDCSKQSFHTRQHKLRVVLQGEVNSLTFVTKDNDVQPSADHRNLFVMNGGWPHYMTNTFDDWKYTICLGAPWEGGDTDEYISLIENSQDVIELDKNYLPIDYEQYFEDTEARKRKFENETS